MNVVVGVDVAAPVIVAALVNWNDGVALINAVNEHAHPATVAADSAGIDLLKRIVAMLTNPSTHDRAQSTLTPRLLRVDWCYSLNEGLARRR